MKSPRSIIAPRSALVAAITRTSTSIGSVPPILWNVWYSTTRWSRAWASRLRFAISSRKSVPRWACSKTPTCRSVAPVKDPFSCPKRWETSSSSWKAPQLTIR